MGTRWSDAIRRKQNHTQQGLAQGSVAQLPVGCAPRLREVRYGQTRTLQKRAVPLTLASGRNLSLGLLWALSDSIWASSCHPGIIGVFLFFS